MDPQPKRRLLTREAILAAPLPTTTLQLGALRVTVRHMTGQEFLDLCQRMRRTDDPGRVRAELLALTVAEADRVAFLAALVAGVAEADLEALYRATVHFQGKYLERAMQDGWRLWLV